MSIARAQAKCVLFIAAILAALGAVAAPASAQTPTYTEGTHYARIATPVRTSDPAKIEVTELFWYGCGYCYMLQPALNQWSSRLPADVAFVRSPAIWRPAMRAQAQVYYTALALNKEDVIHKAAFDAIHVQRRRLNQQSEIEALFVRNGISADVFRKTSNSFGVGSAVQKAEWRTRSYGSQGTPEMIVNGKYRVNPQMAGSQTAMLQVVDFLIAKERAANAD